MKKNPRKSYALCGILLLTLSLYGCGTGISTASSQKGTTITQDEVFYVPEEILLPEYSTFDGAYSDGYDLYYAAANYQEASQTFQTDFYSLKRGETEPKLIFSLPENKRVQSMTMDQEGNIYYLGYEEPPLDSAVNPETNETILYKTDWKGTPLLEISLSEYVQSQGLPMIQGLAVDSESRIVLYDTKQNLYLLNPEGSLLFEIRTDGRIYDICRNDENILVVYHGVEGMEIREVDIPGKQLASKLVSGIPGTQFHMTVNQEGNLLIASEESVYQYSPKENKTIKKFDWKTYDFSRIVSGMLLPYGENGVLAINRNFATLGASVYAFREAAEGEVTTTEKTVITLGIPEKLQWVRGDAISNFNKANPAYRVETKNYQGDYARLNMELIAGTGPDILVLPSYRANLLADKGILADLNPYFDTDETINRSDCHENILKAFETDGHLYVMPVTFRISTLVGKDSFLEGRKGWTLDEFLSFAENYPEGTPFFDNTSKSGVLRLLKYAYTKQLVDMKNPDAPLNRELFIKMLTFANQYENDEKYVQKIGMLNYKMLTGQVMLPDVILVGADDPLGYSFLFGEPVTCVGYPTEEGSGSLIISDNTYAINSGSEHKEAAWEFISTLLTDKGQQLMWFGDFSLRKDRWKNHIDASLRSRNSNVWSATMIGDSDTSTSDLSYDYPAGTKVTEEDVQVVLELIQNAGAAVYIYPDIDKIIFEEAALYFSGAKPVEEVIDVIENRIRTYVNENN